MSEPSYEPVEVLRVLERLHVEYVVVGGYGAQQHGSLRPTTDVDVTPATDHENLRRLAAALEELGARIRTDAVAGGLPFSTSADALAGLKMLNLVTRYGDMDLTFSPSGTGGYPDLVRGAVERQVGTVVVRVASLDDIIRSKTAAGRLKDFEALDELRALAGRGVVGEGAASPTAEVAMPDRPRTAREQRLDRARALVERKRRPAVDQDRQEPVEDDPHR